MDGHAQYLILFHFTKVQYKSQYLVDPTLTEEEGVSDGQRGGGAGGHVTVVYLSSLDEVTAVKQNGCMLPDNLMTVCEFRAITHANKPNYSETSLE